jgi:hypothetical protein
VESFVPRDVTNVSWRERSDSVPQSLRSQSTISSSRSSPVHAALPIDNHEPVIRDSWHNPTGTLTPTRARNNSFLGGLGGLAGLGGERPTPSGDDYDPFKWDSGVGSGLSGAGSKSTLRNQLIISTGSPAPSFRSSIPAGSPSLFQKVRSMFENQGAGSDSASSSPSRSRPTSGIYTGGGARRARSSSIYSFSSFAEKESQKDGGYYGGGEARKGGFLNEHEDEIDEQSALLRSAAGGLDDN